MGVIAYPPVWMKNTARWIALFLLRTEGAVCDSVGDRAALLLNKFARCSSKNAPADAEPAQCLRKLHGIGTAIGKGVEAVA
jgi:hypothetical protein